MINGYVNKPVTIKSKGNVGKWAGKKSQRNYVLSQNEMKKEEQIGTGRSLEGNR